MGSFESKEKILFKWIFVPLQPHPLRHILSSENGKVGTFTFSKSRPVLSIVCLPVLSLDCFLDLFLSQYVDGDLEPLYFQDLIYS